MVEVIKKWNIKDMGDLFKIPILCFNKSDISIHIIAIR